MLQMKRPFGVEALDEGTLDLSLTVRTSSQHLLCCEGILPSLGQLVLRDVLLQTLPVIHRTTQ